MKPIVYMMLGPPGSGKTTFSKQLAKKLSTPRYSLDEEYFELVRNTEQKYRDFDIEKQVGEEIKTKLLGHINSGNSVVLDFCPWKYEERIQYKEFIESNGANCHIYYFDVPENELLNRLTERNQQNDPSAQFMTPEMLVDFSKRFDLPKNEDVEIIKPE
jgi:adenylate kinase family enzyme